MDYFELILRLIFLFTGKIIDLFILFMKILKKSEYMYRFWFWPLSLLERTSVFHQPVWSTWQRKMSMTIDLQTRIWTWKIFCETWLSSLFCSRPLVPAQPGTATIRKSLLELAGFARQDESPRSSLGVPN